MELNYYNLYNVRTGVLKWPSSYKPLNSDGKYILAEPVSLSAGSYVYFDLSTNASSRLELGGAWFDIPATDEMTRYIIFIDQDTVLRDFSFQSRNPEINLTDLSAVGEYPESSFLSVVFNGKVTSVRTGTDSFPLFLNFESDSTENVENIELILGYDEKTENFGIRTRTGDNPYWLYQDESDLVPGEVSVSVENSVLSKIERSLVFSEDAALPIDLESLLYRNPALWRQKGYEIYNWNDFPGMLIIDTADYSIQSDFFKRMAFFTEKKISAGELLSDAELKPLHGWNAHDYRAADLARFFNEAAKENFPLNDREHELRRILIANDVLKETSGRVRPSKGGILSISRESSDNLRYLFLTHECYHGVFFFSDEYVSSVTGIWQSLAEEERNFWRSFLDMYGYNVSDEYLLINEFQAYLMQQKTELADAYFRGKINWMLGIRPDLVGEMRSLLANYGDTFTKSANLVENSAFSLTGIKAGDLVLKRKK
ncbi:MAG: hypothetical protein JXR86_06075 [Spirochaetales bacterium]|nr:hypothetical protein [Spirochaetales bacterium]